MVHKIFNMIRAKDIIVLKLFKNFSVRFIFGCFNMFKCIQRFYADTVAYIQYLHFYSFS